LTQGRTEGTDRTMKHRITALALTASLLVTVFACDESTSVAPIVPPPDAGPGTVADAEVAHDAHVSEAAADASTCTGTIHGFVPPPFTPVAMEACTSAQIESYAVACGPDDFAAACLAWKADTANASCGACILRTDGNGPLRYYKDGKFASLNEGACLALAGEPACGAAVDAAYTCGTTACGDCPGGKETGACYEKVYTGDCKSFTDAQLECESILTGPPADCIVVPGTFGKRLRKVTTLMCGMKTDAGPVDASAD
jgi:hypothetical protein